VTVNIWAIPVTAMNDHIMELAQRRARLQAKAAAQRQRLGTHMSAIDARISGFDRGFVNVRNWVRSPLLLAGGAALLIYLGPRRALKFVGRTALLVSSARRLFRLVW
jgi:hypothetical protein